jgi:hypothetical protein
MPPTNAQAGQGTMPKIKNVAVGCVQAKKETIE